MRCDVNISVHQGDAPFGTRCEIKNLNSIRQVRQALGNGENLLIQTLQMAYLQKNTK
jgi:Asp-tRNA(Asn)/Glu-tRNA(Gln) amidotransferase B subunit